MNGSTPPFDPLSKHRRRETCRAFIDYLRGGVEAAVAELDRVGLAKISEADPSRRLQCYLLERGIRPAITVQALEKALHPSFVTVGIESHTLVSLHLSLRSLVASLGAKVGLSSEGKDNFISLSSCFKAIKASSQSSDKSGIAIFIPQPTSTGVLRPLLALLTDAVATCPGLRLKVIISLTMAVDVFVRRHLRADVHGVAAGVLGRVEFHVPRFPATTEYLDAVFETLFMDKEGYGVFLDPDTLRGLLDCFWVDSFSIEGDFWPRVRCAIVDFFYSQPLAPLFPLPPSVTNAEELGDADVELLREIPGISLDSKTSKSAATEMYRSLVKEYRERRIRLNFVVDFVCFLLPGVVEKACGKSGVFVEILKNGDQSEYLDQALDVLTRVERAGGTSRQLWVRRWSGVRLTQGRSGHFEGELGVLLDEKLDIKQANVLLQTWARFDTRSGLGGLLTSAALAIPRDRTVTDPDFPSAIKAFLKSKTSDQLSETAGGVTDHFVLFEALSDVDDRTAVCDLFADFVSAVQGKGQDREMLRRRFCRALEALEHANLLTLVRVPKGPDWVALVSRLCT